MKHKNLIIEYLEYDNIESVPLEEKALLNLALDAAENAYAPYSGFKVGAAVKLSNGEVVTASNQENSAFPSGLCAERVALFYANSRFPDASVVSIAITALKDGKQCKLPTYPCGACRQVMVESQKRAGNNIKIIFGGSETTQVVNSVEGILPFAFDDI